MNILKLLFNYPFALLAERFYKKSQYWDRKILEKYQNEQLISLVKYVSKNVPYYKNLFKEIGLNTNEFRGIQDLNKIPLLEKETIRNNPDSFISTQKRITFFDEWHSTSGSTGKPLRVLFNRKGVIHKMAVTKRAFAWANYRVGNRVLSVTDVSPDNVPNFKLNTFTKTLTYYSNQIQKEKVLSFHPKLIEFNPEVIWGYGYSILMMGRFLKEADLTIPKVKSIINYGENISDSVKLEIEKIFEAPLYDYYSHIEKVVLASQCKHGRQHIAEDFSYIELLDKNGHPSTSGEVVGTTLTNYTMPLIRYKTGDNALLDNSKCECGVTLHSFKTIEGRLHDGIKTPDGRFIFLAEGAISESDFVIAGQYVQEKIETLKVNLIVDKRFSDTDKENIRKGLILRFGDEINIEICIVDKLEMLPNGKTPFVISKLSKSEMPTVT